MRPVIGASKMGFRFESKLGLHWIWTLLDGVKKVWIENRLKFVCLRLWTLYFLGSNFSIYFSDGLLRAQVLSGYGFVELGQKGLDWQWAQICVFEPFIF